MSPYTRDVERSEVPSRKAKRRDYLKQYRRQKRAEAAAEALAWLHEASLARLLCQELGYCRDTVAALAVTWLETATLPTVPHLPDVSDPGIAFSGWRMLGAAILANAAADILRAAKDGLGAEVLRMWRNGHWGSDECNPQDVIPGTITASSAVVK